MSIFIEYYTDLGSQEITKIAQIGWQNNFESSSSGILEFGYIMGYKNAADILVDEVDDLLQRDSLVFPIVYNYRHYLELLLKHIAKLTNINFKKNHNLSRLWDEVKINIDVSSEQKALIEGVIHEFNHFDERSTNFRYSDEFSKTEILYVNLIQLKDAIDNIDEILFQYYG